MHNLLIIIFEFLRMKETTNSLVSLTAKKCIANKHIIIIRKITDSVISCCSRLQEMMREKRRDELETKKERLQK